MYAVVAIGLMVVVPAASVAIEFLLSQGALYLPLLIGKWFTFWGIGARLLLAGVNQAVRPGFTAQHIFNITDQAAESIITELGFANMAFGLIGLLSLPFPTSFLTAAAVAGGLFLLLDGILHMRSRDRSRNETIALVTDLVIPLATIIYLTGEFLRRAPG